MALNIALVGFGAIGTSLLELVKADADLRVAAVVVSRLPASNAQQIEVKRLAPYARLVSRVPTEGIDLVVETAGHSAIEQHVMPALARGVPAVVVSVGALSEPGLPERLEAAARAGNTQVQLIAGAIGALDALGAARIGGLTQVRYTGRKPPEAWRGTLAEQTHDLSALTAETVIFEGSAREAARLYPKNANVAASVALAGLGLDGTQVCLIADPRVNENVHQIAAEGAFGSLELTLRNHALAANPKTSALTVFSAVRAVRAHVSPLLNS